MSYKYRKEMFHNTFICKVCKNHCRFCNTGFQCDECEEWERENRSGVPVKPQKIDPGLQKIYDKYPPNFD